MKISLVFPKTWLEKSRIYAQYQAPYIWLIDPQQMSLRSIRLNLPAK